MTVSNGKSAMDVLTDFAKYTNDCHARGVEPALDEALAALEEIMVAARPMIHIPDTEEARHFAKYAGKLLDQYERNIRQAFSNGGGE